MATAIRRWIHDTTRRRLRTANPAANMPPDQRHESELISRERRALQIGDGELDFTVRIGLPVCPATALLSGGGGRESNWFA